MSKNSKQRLFEVMQRLDKTFKPKLNEEFGANGMQIQQQPQQINNSNASISSLQKGQNIKFKSKDGSIKLGNIYDIAKDGVMVKINKPTYAIRQDNFLTDGFVTLDNITEVEFQNKWYSANDYFNQFTESVNEEFGENDTQQINNFNEIDGKTAWIKADSAGKQALEQYKQQNPNDKYGGSSVLGATIWVKGKPFPNPTVDLQVAGLESMGLNRMQQDNYHQKGSDGTVEWYGIPNLISQGSIFQEVYANAVMNSLKSQGFETKYDYGRMD